MTYWALRILTSARLSAICDALPGCFSTKHDSTAILEASLLACLHAQTLIHDVKNQYSHAHRFAPASKIMSAVPYSTTDNPRPPRGAEMYLSTTDSFGRV